MQEEREIIMKRIKELAESGEITRILAWERGLFENDVTPMFFDALDADKVEISDFCVQNLSKILACKPYNGKNLVLLKPCDSRAFDLLVRENKIERESVYALGVSCKGMSEIFDKCKKCKNKCHTACDELIGDCDPKEEHDDFDDVKEIEKLSPTQRYEFWQNELSRCIRCNACRDICPVCTCEKCVFVNTASGVESKTQTGSDDDKLYHIIRAYHVAGRCVDCNECSRVCPEHIPLYLLNRKLVKDINTFWGENEGLTQYKPDDIEPDAALERSGTNA